jgi:hypothetical protein
MTERGRYTRRLRQAAAWRSQRYASGRQHLPRWVSATLLVGGGLVLGLIIGLCSSAGSGTTVTVNVRPGAPPLTGNSRALVELRADLVDTLIRQSLVQAKLPFELTDVKTTFAQDGIKIAGRAGGTVLHIPISVSWDGTIAPSTDSEGKIAVHLVNVHAAGGRLPNFFDALLEQAIDDQLNAEVGAMPGFQVTQVELAPQALLVYMNYEPPP